MSLGTLSIRAKLLVMLGASALGVVVLGGVAFRTLGRVKVNGPLYQEIVLGKDLVADILPPPAYLVESYLVAHQLALASDPDMVSGLTARGAQLRKEYGERHTFWESRLEESALHAAMLRDAHEPAQEFFSVWDKTFMPAVRAGDREKALEVLGTELTRAFQRHREAIDRVVGLANERNATHEASAAAQTGSATWILLGTVIAVLAAIGFGGRLMVIGIIGLLENVTKAIETAATGDLTVHIDGAQVRDEAVARSFEQLLSTLRSSVRQIADTSMTIATAAEELTSVSESMTLTASETASQAHAVAAASDEVMEHLTTVSTASNEMGSAINEISSSASSAAQVAARAVAVVETTSTTMQQLDESSARIGEVVRLISSVAEQTNLLALNASIEAARAGEAGKGFAVVANEVKELAAETTRATADIAERIQNIQHDTRTAVDAIREIGEIVGQINQAQSTIASAVEQQTATTSEIARNLGEASRGGNEIASNVASVANATKETTAGAANTREAATELSRMAVTLQGLVSQFRYQA